MRKRSLAGYLATAALLVTAAASALGAQSPESRIAAQVQARAAAEGRVRVIVELSAEFKPEGTLDGTSRAAQRSRISRVRETLFSRLGVPPRSIRPYATIPYVALEVDAAMLAAMERSAEVRSVREDVIREPTLSESGPLIGATVAWSRGATGSGWTVAVLDTGIDATHPFVGGKIVSEACYSTNGQNSVSLCPGGVATSETRGAASDCTLPGACEHGTHVAGIAAGSGSGFSGIGRDATLLPIQVFSYINSRNGLGAYDSDILHGLERVYALRGSFNIAAVNLSLGGEAYTSYCDAIFPAYKAAFDQLVSVGIAPVVASGNNGYGNAVSAPACISSAVSVGATTKGDQVSDFTNSANMLRLLAPGSSIVSSVPGGGFAALSGTSMAAPHVAGAWAALKSRKPSASYGQILGALEGTGAPIHDPLNGLVRPRINVAGALDALVPRVTSIVASPGSPQRVGTPITWTASATGVSNEYRFWLLNIGTSTRIELRGYSPGNSVSWTPLQAGDYEVEVWVRSIGETASYENVLSGTTFTVTGSAVPILVSVTADRSFPSAFGATITWEALAVGGTGPLEYQFWRFKVGSGPGSGWTLVQPYSVSATYRWTPSLADAGTYSLQVWVRQVASGFDYQSWLPTEEFGISDGTFLFLNSESGDYIGQGLQQSVLSARYTVTATRNGQNGVSLSFLALPSFWYADFAALAGVTLTPGEYREAVRNTGTPVAAGLSVSGDGRGCNQLTGRFVVLDVAFGPGNDVQRFAADFEQHCEGLTPALFGSVRFNSPLEASLVPARATGLQIGSNRDAGKNIPLTALAVGGAGGALEYKFWVYRLESAQWTMIRDFGPAGTAWTPSQPGTYTIQAWVRSIGSAASYESWIGSSALAIVAAPITGLSIVSTSPSPVPIGSPTTWTAHASGGIGPLQYRFWRSKIGGGWTMVRDYSPADTFTWTPGLGDEGTYAIQVWIRNAGSTASYDAWIGTGEFTVGIGVSSLAANRISPLPTGLATTWTATATGGLAPLQFRFWLYKVGVGWTMVQEYSAANTFSWTPAAGDTGTYAIQVWVRSAGSAASYEGWLGTDYFTVGGSPP